ncbi:MAG TPA: hypothetical protein GX497_13735 [Bacillus bacterium]|nr:hypothetical protein [Bacillus sp. (in: firmicutes)]
MLGFIIIFFIICGVIGMVLGFFVFLGKSISDSVGSKDISCPNCSKEMKLLRNGSDCPKCKVRVYENGDGEIKFN